MQWCNRLIWIDGGVAYADRVPEEILSAYLPPDQFQQARTVASRTAA
ncbi:hypothetical protein [Acidocella sp.]|nr:hypothetical protein [Acidocella sp.]